MGSNRIHLSDLQNMPESALRALSPDILRLLQDDLKNRKVETELLVGRVNRAFELRYADTVEGERTKETGRVRVRDGEYEAICDVDKKVTWDQKKLAAIVAQLKREGEDVSDYVETTIKVPERKFAVWPKRVKEIFEPARTEKAGSPKWSVEFAA